MERSNSVQPRASTAYSEGGASDEGLAPSQEVLATLSALGVSEELRAKVQAAIEQLDLATSDPALVDPSARGSGKKGAPAQPKPPPAKGVQQTAEAKLAMSRSIMRKLHYKNVALEKELQAR